VIPKNAQPGSLKLRLSFSGYNASMNKPAVPTGSSAYITFAVNAHSMENGQPSSYYENLKASLGEYGFAAEDYADPSTSYFRNMILRDVQALRFAKTLPEWNGRDIELSGGSMGGFQATAVAALEPGVTKLSVQIVWMCDVSGRSVGRLEGWLPEYTENLNYFDSVNFAARVKCPTSISRAGLIDYTTTPIGVAAYYNALKVEKNISFVQSGEHVNNPKIPAGTYTRYN
jgi:cephalosporin-C deacetylase-like acetyl esterase